MEYVKVNVHNHLIFCFSVAAYAFDDAEKKRRARLSDKTICMVSLEKDGEYTHYNSHSLYGHFSTKATRAYVSMKYFS